MPIAPPATAKPGPLAADGFCTTIIHSKRKNSKPSLRFAIHPKPRYSLMAVEAGGIGAASAGDAEPRTRLPGTLSPDSILSFWDWEHSTCHDTVHARKEVFAVNLPSGFRRHHVR